MTSSARSGDRPVEDAPTSWAYAEIATDTGLFSSTARLGRGVAATAAIAAETVRRLLQSDRGKAGAWTPGAAFGPEFVPAVTGMLVTGNESEAVRR
ncbi:hypothetical protein VMT65_31725 [Nocardia sp. CDC153]|uniref:hypothetical protein n=1 Tax=Nocardia sp. CDC153 TaxID=3112167 RepID=UPI002DB5644C|nr:hypothetical protein [Nocardia sp. CDC153]MEC3957641.1 hypothetical protein [Nocardia sp. CDC153]